MADDEDVQQSQPEEPTYSQPEAPQTAAGDEWAAFRLKDQPQQAAAGGDEWAKYRLPGSEAKPEESSTLGTFARGIGRGVIPGTAAIAGAVQGAEVGGAIGGAIGTAVPGIGTVIGGGVGGFLGAVGGGLAGGYVGGKAQNTIADTLNLDSPESRERDVTAHPYAEQLGEAVPMLGSLSTSGTLAARVAAGGVMGGIDVINQGISKGVSNIDPTEALIAGGVGAAAPTPRGWIGGKGAGLGQAAATAERPTKFFGDQAAANAEALPERPAPQGDQGVVRVENPAMAPDIQAVFQAKAAPSPGMDVKQGPGEFQSEALDMAGQGVDEGLPRSRYGTDTQQTPPLTPEQVEANRAELAATPGPPMRSARGNLLAPQARNIADANDLSNIGNTQYAPTKRLTPTPEPAPAAPSSPAADALRARLVRQAEQNGVTVSPEELDRRVSTIMAEQAQAAPPRTPTTGEVGEIPSFLRRGQPAENVESQKIPAAEVGGQNENAFPVASAAENAAIAEMPRPQSLGAAAPPSGAAGTYEIPQGPPGATKLKNASLWQGLNKTADNLFKLPQWLVAPHTLSDEGMAADRINRKNMGEVFGKEGEYQTKIQDAMAAQEAYFRNMAPEQRLSAVTEFENGVIDKNHPGSQAMEAARKVSDEQYSELAKAGATASYAKQSLSGFFPDYQRQAYGDWAQSFHDDNKRWPTLGDALRYRPPNNEPGFKLRDELLNADGSPDVGAVLAKNIHAKNQAIMRTNIIRDAREGWGKQGGIDALDPILHDSPREGDVKLNQDLTGGIPLYGAPEVKAVFERYLNPTIHDPTIRNAYDSYMSLKSASNAINLIGGVYHMRFMLQESVINDVSRGMARLLNGDAKGLKDIVQSPAAPVRLYGVGKNFVLDAIQHPENIKDPFDKIVVGTLKEGGQLPPGRIRGGGITPELETGALHGLVTAWKPAFEDYMHNVVQSGLKIKNKAGQGDYLGAAKDTGIASLRALSEGMQVIMHPMFSKYIPLIKAGANFSNMKQFMIDNPGLSHDEYVNMARKFVNATDNAMGELNQSMLYAPAWMKALGNGTTVSLGWQIGDVKQFLGGARQFVRNPASAKFGKDYDPRVMYIPAFLAVTALSNVAYQLLKGQGGPQDITDVIAPRTGGKTKSGTPERAIQPGYEKDVLETSNIIGGPESTSKTFAHYMYNKLASLPKTAIDEFIFNQDFAGKQIVNPNDPLAKRLHDYMGYAMQHMLVPILAQQATHEEKNKNTNIGKFEQFLGNRHAPQQWQEPQKYLSRVQKENKKAADEAKTFHQKTGY